MFVVEKKLPWGVILLLGGGFALSDATEQWVYNSWVRIFKLLCSPGIDSKEPIPPAYVAWRPRYDNPIPTRFLAPTQIV
jgi:hypothetical protein